MFFLLIFINFSFFSISSLKVSAVTEHRLKNLDNYKNSVKFLISFDGSDASQYDVDKYMKIEFNDIPDLTVLYVMDVNKIKNLTYGLEWDLTENLKFMRIFPPTPVLSADFSFWIMNVTIVNLETSFTNFGCFFYKNRQFDMEQYSANWTINLALMINAFNGKYKIYFL